MLPDQRPVPSTTEATGQLQSNAEMDHYPELPEQISQLKCRPAHFTKL